MKTRVTIVANAVLAVLTKRLPGTGDLASLAGEIAVAAIDAADHTAPDEPHRLPTAVSMVTT